MLANIIMMNNFNGIEGIEVKKILVALNLNR
jgi:hypothetical protein